MSRYVPCSCPHSADHRDQAPNRRKRHIHLATSSPGLMLRRHTANGLRITLSRGASLSSLTARCPQCATFYAQHASSAFQTPTASFVPARGKKTKTVVRLSDLPQGVIQTERLPEQETTTEPAYPTVVLQARRNMDKFDNCVLLTRVGGFYELYFEHADELAPLLNLKLASKRTNAGPVPMVSLPHPQTHHGYYTMC